MVAKQNCARNSFALDGIIRVVLSGCCSLTRLRRCDFAQDWATHFTGMQAVFPSWVTTLIINYPDRFTSMATCWTAINAEAMRQAAGRKSGLNGRVLQLSDPMLAGEMEAYPEEFYDEALPGPGSALCAMGRVPGCWRCGDMNHRVGTAPSRRRRLSKRVCP